MNYILLILGFALIIKASDVLIDSAKAIAIKFKVSKVLIALTIVAFGTSAPELAISFKSIMSDNGSIALSNIIGSSIVNVLLAIGLTAISYPIKIKKDTIKKELPILVLVTIVFTIIIANGLLNGYKHNTLNTFDGLLLLLVFVIFIIYIVQSVRKVDRSYSQEKSKYGMIKSIIYLVISIVVIIFSADLLVDSAITISNNLGVSEKVITMVVIVIGTSLPEIFLTVASAKKKEHEMAIGNIIGTNIFNICIVMGLPIVIFNGFTIVDFDIIDIGVVLISSLLLYIFAKSEKTLSRKEGILMISIFLLYYSYIIFFQ